MDLKIYQTLCADSKIIWTKHCLERMQERDISRADVKNGIATGEINMCMFCKNTTTIQSTTTHVVNYKDCIIVIKNVPCLECDQCGEKYYTDEVAEKLEMIVNMAKKLVQEIAVIDYKQAA